MITMFNYLYRDAGNFKSFGSLALSGALSPNEISAIQSRFIADNLLIAEQLGIPPLYEALYRWSNGPIPSDHCWHEFVDIRLVGDADLPCGAFRWGPAKDFLALLMAINVWNEEMSPHFRLGAA